MAVTPETHPSSFCRNGHEFTAENSRWVNHRGKRERTCWICRTAAGQRYRARNREALAASQQKQNVKRRAEGYYQQWHQDVGYWRTVQRKYGVTREWYEAALAAQGGVCAVCGKAPEQDARRFAVDHDHVTGDPRGVICKECNTGMGHFRDNPDLLLSAAAYLLARTDILGKVT